MDSFMFLWALVFFFLVSFVVLFYYRRTVRLIFKNLMVAYYLVKMRNANRYLNNNTSSSTLAAEQKIYAPFFAKLVSRNYIKPSGEFDDHYYHLMFKDVRIPTSIHSPLNGQFAFAQSDTQASAIFINEYYKVVFVFDRPPEDKPIRVWGTKTKCFEAKTEFEIPLRDVKCGEMVCTLNYAKDEEPQEPQVDEKHTDDEDTEDTEDIGEDDETEEEEEEEEEMPGGYYYMNIGPQLLPKQKFVIFVKSGESVAPGQVIGEIKVSK